MRETRAEIVRADDHSRFDIGAASFPAHTECADLNGILSHWARVIREAYVTAPDARFAIHVGDLVNFGSRDFEWAEWFKSVSFIHGMIPALPVVGNHEYYDGLVNEARAVLQRTAENTQFFQVISIDGDSLSYEARTATGVLYDAFRIDKQRNRPNRITELPRDATAIRSFDNTGEYRNPRLDAVPPLPSTVQ